MCLSGILSKTKAFSCLRKEATGRYSPWFTWMSSAMDRCFKPPCSIFKLYSHTAISLKNVSLPLKCTWLEIFTEISDTHCSQRVSTDLERCESGGSPEEDSSFGEDRFLLHHNHHKMSLSSAHADALTQCQYLNIYSLLTTATYQKCFMGGDKLANCN